MRFFINFKYLFIVLLIILIILLFLLHKITSINTRNIGDLLEERAGHSALILPDTKRILFVGGSNGKSNSYLSNAEVYNIATNKNERIITTTLPHAFPNLYMNSEKKIVLVDNNGIEIYDINENKFNLIKEKPFDVDNYFNESQKIQISDDLILITGGKTSQNKIISPKTTKNAYIYNIKSNKILNSLKLNVPRSNHQMIPYNNEIYIFGGLSNNIQDTLLVEKYIPTINKFIIIGKIKEPRTDFKVYRYNDLIILAGGLGKNNIEVYDLKNNSSHIYKNFIIECNTSIKNSDIEILKVNKDIMKFIYKNKSKSLSGIYQYNFKTQTVNLIKKIPIGKYSNVLSIGENEIILSGGETQFTPLSQLLSLFMTKTCVKGKICTMLPINKKIQRIRMKGVL